MVYINVGKRRVILLILYIYILQPNAQYPVAHDLAYHLMKQKEDGDDPKLAIAIAMQESSLLGREGSMVDYGLFNLHLDTLINYGINPSNLKGVECIGCQVSAYYILMRDKIRKCHKHGEEAWSCFHSATPHLREKYVVDVTKHLHKLNGGRND